MIVTWRASEQCLSSAPVPSVISDQHIHFLVAFPVLCEAHTLVLCRLGAAYGANWLREMLSGSLPVNLGAATSLQKYSDHPTTPVEALLARMTRMLGVPVWSFDRHFVTMRTSI